MKIVFATNNKNKLSEIREILGSGFEVMSLAEIMSSRSMVTTVLPTTQALRLMLSTASQAFIAHVMPREPTMIATLIWTNCCANWVMRHIVRHASVP